VTIGADGIIEESALKIPPAPRWLDLAKVNRAAPH
jgi:hypothetical protein